MRPGVNASGQIVGWSYISGHVTDAFLYSNGVMTDLGAGEATGVNASGQVVGYSAVANGYAFLYSNATRTNLGRLPGSLSSEAFGINDNGQIVGSSYFGTGRGNHAFLYSDGVMTDFGLRDRVCHQCQRGGGGG